METPCTARQIELIRLEAQRRQRHIINLANELAHQASINPDSDCRLVMSAASAELRQLAGKITEEA